MDYFRSLYFTLLFCRIINLFGLKDNNDIKIKEFFKKYGISDENKNIILSLNYWLARHSKRISTKHADYEFTIYDCIDKRMSDLFGWHNRYGIHTKTHKTLIVQ